MSNKATSSAPSQRMRRVGELVRHALSSFLMRDEIEDDTLAGVHITVPEVRMTPDLKIANAYVMPLGGANAEAVTAALNRHHRFIRGQISPDLALKYAPDLRFHVDTSFAEADRIESLLRSDRVKRDLESDDND